MEKIWQKILNGMNHKVGKYGKIHSIVLSNEGDVKLYEIRHRRTSQCREEHFIQRDHESGRGGGQLSVLHY